MVKPILLRTDSGLKMGERLKMDFDQLVQVVTAEDDREETILRLCPQASIIYTCYAPITQRVIFAAEKLLGIVKYGVGLDSIDLKAAYEKGIPVVNCPDYGTEAVADHTFALLINLARKLNLIDRKMHDNAWLWPDQDYIAYDLYGKTLGIIGMGKIGKAMARRATGFGMRILAYDPYVNPAVFTLPLLEWVDFDTVLAESDFLSLHCILTGETKGIISRSTYEKMKSDVLLVNTARGALIDEEALVNALRENRIGGAALDVFSDEPLDKSHPLFMLPNVIMTPHIAFYSREAFERLERECFEAVHTLLQGKLPVNTVNADMVRQYNMA